jgi:hypothetical protein
VERLRCCTLLLVASLSACAGAGSQGTGAPQVVSTLPAMRRQTAGPGPILGSKFGGSIYGWDMDQNGTDGLITETVLGGTGTVINVIETFDESTAQIVKVVRKTIRNNASVEPVADAIAGSDVGIVDVENDLASLQRDDHFDLLNTVLRNKITGQTKPPHMLGIVPNFVTSNQASSSQVMVAYYEKNRVDQVGLYTYDTVRNAWSKRIDFSRKDLFQLGAPTYAAVDATTNEAVVGYLDASRYNPHESSTFDVMDAATGKHLRSFYGVGYGWPNGMAIDSTTDTMCTTTTRDMDVEFYNLSTGKGKTVTIPTLYGGGGETNGAAVAADPVNHLFLVAQLNSTLSPDGGSSVLVYDEHGKLVEYINGLNFFFFNSVIVPRIAVNPSLRIGYVNGPNVTQLQEFTY